MDGNQMHIYPPQQTVNYISNTLKSNLRQQLFISILLGNKRPATTSSFSEVVIKKLNNESLGRTPKSRKTPSKSPSRLDFTPRGSKPNTPSRSGGDRFIPSRSAIDWDASKFLLQHRSDFLDTNSSSTMSPQKIEHQKKMALNLCGMCLIEQFVHTVQVDSDELPQQQKK